MEGYWFRKEILCKKFPFAYVTSLEIERIPHDCIHESTRSFNEPYDEVWNSEYKEEAKERNSFH
jgi:hypothetical protein